MNVTDARRLVLLAWLGLVGIVVAREVQSGYVPPRPGVFVPGALAYTVLGGLTEASPPLALVLAGMFDIAAVLTPFLKDPKTSPLAMIFGWLDNSGVIGGKKS